MPRRVNNTPAPAQTGWFSRSTKPARQGVYGTNASGKAPCFQHWDGDVWGKFSGSPEGAALKAGNPSSIQGVQWYGLAADPTELAAEPGPGYIDQAGK